MDGTLKAAHHALTGFMILHLSTFHLEGGAGVAATRLHRALLRSGRDSWMLIPKVENPEAGVVPLADTKWKNYQAFGRFVFERLAFYPQEKDKSVRFAFSPAVAGADISAHPLVKKADVIHLHWINFGFLSMDSLEKLFSLGKPIVWTQHDMWALTGGCHYSRGCEHYVTHCQYCPFLAKPDQYDISFSQFLKKEHSYKLGKMAFVSPSHWLDQLTAHAHLTKQIQHLTIPNCLDTTLFKPGDKRAIKQSLNLPTDKLLILFAGANTQDPRKGFHYFKEAIRLIQNTHNDIEVLIFGKSGAASFDSFPSPVHYLGKITETAKMIDVYNAADLILVPSLEDNLPNTIMEAMACGTPAVGFETGGIPEMIDHLKNGFIATLKSSESLAEGIKWTLTNNREGKLSENARRKVLENYAETVITEKYGQLYDSLL